MSHGSPSLEAEVRDLREEMEDLRSEVVRLRREVREFRHERDSRRSVDSRSDSRGGFPPSPSTHMSERPSPEPEQASESRACETNGQSGSSPGTPLAWLERVTALGGSSSTALKADIEATVDEKRFRWRAGCGSLSATIQG